MLLDSFTALLATCVAIIFLGCALLYFWNRDRGSPWLLWWSMPLLLGGATIAIALRPNWQGDFLSIVPGNAMRITALCLLWQGARVFERRPPLLLPVALAPLAWMLLCLIPAFYESTSARIIGVSIFNAAFCCLAARELWLGRAERLPSRNAAIGVSLSFAGLMLTRIVLIDVLPFPMGGLPFDPTWMGLFTLAAFVHAAFLAFLVIAMTKERLELEQRNLALLDPLTGLMNRRAFMGEAERQARRPLREHQSTALLVLDLDHFKSVNDRFGHNVGDRVLARFARIAEANTRPTDQLYRMGGEEFCFVLPDTSLEDAATVGERVRQAFAADAISAGGETVSATVSIGVAAGQGAGADIAALLAAADAAVYKAKASGRDRVVAVGSGKPERLRPRAEMDLRRRSA